MMLPLAKFDAGENRDAKGRWTGGSLTVPSVRRKLEQAGSDILQRAPAIAEGATGNGPQPGRQGDRAREGGAEVGPDERRSLIRSSLAARASKTLIPASYTGSSTPERQVDGWKDLQIRPQVPKALPVEEHIALMGKLKAIIQTRRQPATEHAKVTRQLVAVHGYKDRYTLKRRTGPLILDPATPRGATNRAYNHAALLALHGFGALDYDFKMSDAQKQELTPLVPFMRYVRRHLLDEMKRGDLKGALAPYRAEFGQKFPTPKFTKPKPGRPSVERLRVRPNDEFIKRAPMLPLAKFEEDKHPRGEDGKWSSAIAAQPFTAAMAGSTALASVASGAGIAGGLLNSKMLRRGVPKSVAIAVVPAIMAWNAAQGAVATYALGGSGDKLVDEAKARLRGDPGTMSAGQMALAVPLAAIGTAGALKYGGPKAAIMLARVAKAGLYSIAHHLAWGRAAEQAKRAGVRQAWRASKPAVDAGPIVYRAAPGNADFAPQSRQYHAVYVATKKPVTEGYGSANMDFGSTTAYRLHAGTKLFDTADGAGTPEQDALHDALRDAEGTQERIRGLKGFFVNRTAARAKETLDAATGTKSPLDMFMLHVAPTAAQVKILQAAGYHGTIGQSRNIALFDTSRLTPLYAQDRVSGRVKFPKRKPVAKLAPGLTLAKLTTDQPRLSPS